MNIVLYRKSELQSDGTVVLDDFRVEHILTTLKKGVGDEIRVGELQGMQGTAAIVSCSDRSVTIVPTVLELPPKALPVTLVVAMPRPKSFRKLLHTATVMGVKKIVVIKSWRVDKSYLTTPFLIGPERDLIIEDALMQCRDTMAPEIEIRKAFKPFVEDELSQMNKVLLFHPSETGTPLRSSFSEEAVIVIGPEGGFIPYEVDLMLENGAQLVTLGDRIQRVEQAIGSVLGYIAAVCE